MTRPVKAVLQELHDGAKSRQVLAYEMRLQGFTLSVIGSRLGVSAKTVHGYSHNLPKEETRDISKVKVKARDGRRMRSTYRPRRKKAA